MASADKTSPLRTNINFLRWCFFVFAILITVSSISFYQYQQRTLIAGCHTNLTMIANLKANQISSWRLEQISRAHMITANRFLLNGIDSYLDNPSTSTKKLLIQALQPALEGDSYHAIIITDINGNNILHLGADVHRNLHISKQQIELACASATPIFDKMYYNPATKHSATKPTPCKTMLNKTTIECNIKLHMNLILPMYRNNDPNEKRLGTVILIINPTKFLLPLITPWPIANSSGESILVRKLNDKIIRLTPLRHTTTSTLLTEVSPPEDLPTPGQYIHQEREGTLAGYDYRRHKIFAAIKKIPASPWVIVTKIDQAEILRPMVKLGIIIIAIIILLTSSVGTMLWLWWRRQQAINQAMQYQHELQNRTIITRFDSLTKNSNDIIILCDEQGSIIDANEQALASYGHSLEELRQQKLRSMCDMDDEECGILWQQLAVQQEVKFNSKQFRNDGSTFPVEINASWIEVGERKLLQAIIRDVSERHEAQELLLHQAQHDHLTGLPNRTLITDRIKQAITKRKRKQTQTAILFLDIDRFKKINDTLGHATGDKLLTILSQRIQSVLRETDTVARFGGDEFMIMVEDITNIADVANLAQKLINSINQPIFLDQQEVYITTSIGISVAPDDTTNTGQIIRFVETAMYRAKELGRNNYQFYTSDMNAHTRERLELETSLRKALANNEFVVYYQPQIDINNNKIVGSEALVRWQHPQRGLVPPNDFIPIAEETGLITEIGLWVLEQACRQNLEWQKQGYTDLSVAVNLSARQFIDPNLQRDVFDILQRTQLDPHYLELEITESLSMLDVNASIAIMDIFTSHGISIAIDDFGTGYSSLSHLHLFPINKLKIDRSFVELISEQSNGSIIPTIIALSKQLNLKVIAEGVETALQLKILHSLKCPLIQGYYFSKPVSANEFSNLLKKPVKDIIA